MDNQSRPLLRPKKRRRERLIRLAKHRDDWVVGFEDETWWSRVAQPQMHSFAANDEHYQLHQHQVSKDDPDPKALACYGLLVRHNAQQDTLHLRFVSGRPLSNLTTQFLDWCSSCLADAGKNALLLVWDNATWHTSKTVRSWLREHNRQVKAKQKAGVRLVVCFLPSRSPWLNPIEPKWVHGKRRVHEPHRLLSAHELEQRVYATFGCVPESHLAHSA